MPIPFFFQGKFTEKYFKKFYLHKFRFQLLDERFMDLLTYVLGMDGSQFLASKIHNKLNFK